MGHHYVPQYYLRGFADNGRLWAHDRDTKRSFLSQPKAVANENEMYSDELERHLANVVEDPAKDAIADIRSLREPKAEDRKALARYIVALLKRVPEGRTRTFAEVPKVAASLRHEYQAELQAAVAADPSLQDLVNDRLAQLEAVLDKFTQNPPVDIWHSNLTNDASPDVVESLMSMNWRFLCTTQQQFITCDNPVFFFAHEGIGKPTSELTLALSSSVALWANRRPSNGPVFVRTRPAVVRELNRRMAFNASRFLYSRTNEEWIMPLHIKGDYALNRLV